MAARCDVNNVHACCYYLLATWSRSSNEMSGPLLRRTECGVGVGNQPLLLLQITTLNKKPKKGKFYKFHNSASRKRTD